MASVFKRKRWVDAQGRKCRKFDPGASPVKSDVYSIQILVNGRHKLVEG